MQQFQIKKLEIQNFRSIQSKVTLDIKPGLFSVEGKNNDEDTRNGAGKSTLISALYWCLTGSALTNEVLADEIVNNKVGKNCQVSVYLDSNDGEIKITRYRKDSEFGNDLKLEIAGQDISCHKVADTQVRINQLLKIPFELLHSTIIMTHDMKSAFSDLSPQQRVHTLESIRDYSLWDKVRDEANKNIKTYNKEIQDLKLNKSNFEGQLSTYTNIVKTNTDSLDNLRKTSNNTVITESINKKQAELDTTKQSLSSFTQELDKIKAEPVIIDEKLQSELDKIVEEANNIKIDIQKLEFEQKDQERELDIINKWFTNDKCPTCGKPLDRTQAEIDTKTEQKKAFMAKIDGLKVSITNKNNDLVKRRTDWATLNKSVKEQKDKLQQNTAKTVELETKIRELTRKQESIVNEMNDLTKSNEKFKQQEATFTENIAKYTTEITKLEADIKDFDAKIKVLEEKRQLSDYFYKLLGAKGELRPYLLNKDIIYLNNCMQKYIARFFKNTNVNLQLNGAAIDINIESNGIHKTVTSLSGGEKKRLNLSIQFALYDLLQSTSQVYFNMLWLDEIESELDPQGIQQLIEVIEDMSERCGTVMWITNNVTVSENIPNKIICKKILGKTTVEEQ